MSTEKAANPMLVDAASDVPSAARTLSDTERYELPNGRRRCTNRVRRADRVDDPPGRLPPWSRTAAVPGHRLQRAPSLTWLR
jgi:hypothetical protein